MMSPDVDDIGHEQERDERIYDKRRVMAAHVAGEAFTGNPSNLRASHLDCAHEWVREQESPARGVPELRASLRIGGYTAGIVVRRPGNEARPRNSPLPPFEATAPHE